jgi:hypothetical protein
MVEVDGTHVDNPTRYKREGRDIPKTTVGKGSSQMEVYKYRDVLNFAHKAGMVGMRTGLIPSLCDITAGIYTAHATASFADGTTWDGIGDANPLNTNRMVAPHVARMAETRAKARALGDALNLDVNFADEFGGDTADAEDSATFTPRRAARAIASAQPEPTYNGNIACADCGSTIRDSPNFWAEKKAAVSMSKHGRVLCYACSVKATK